MALFLSQTWAIFLPNRNFFQIKDMQNIPLFCLNIISQIHIVWLPVVFKPSLRTVLETLKTHEFNEHDLYQIF